MKDLERQAVRRIKPYQMPKIKAEARLKVRGKKKDKLLV
jgi:hypothetical protein